MCVEIKSAPVMGSSPWLRLLRLPNLLTVPGDPVAGFLLAGAVIGRHEGVLLLPVVGAALCLYCFGLILNDMMDFQSDLRERPDRPLPSGAISWNQARGAAVALALTGLNLALFAGFYVLCIAALLSLFIILYNARFKQIPLLGVLTMGLCRGLSFLMGVGVVWRAEISLSGLAQHTPVVLGFGIVTLSFVAISCVALHEMDPIKRMGIQRYLPFGTLLLLLPALIVAAGHRHTLAPSVTYIYLFLMAMTLLRAWLLGSLLYCAQPVPVTVGAHIRNHLVVQALLCLASGMEGLAPALFLTVLSPVFALCARRFYSS